MRILVVYESMFGNTRMVAAAIAAGLASAGRVDLVPVGRTDPTLVSAADLIVVGAPTHAHGLSRPSTRRAAADQSSQPESTVYLEPDADGIGVREWLASLPSNTQGKTVAFDTRVRGPGWLTGRASVGIARRLSRQRVGRFAAPESFFVTKDNQLRPGEVDRATTWGKELADVLVRQAGTPDTSGRMSGVS